MPPKASPFPGISPRKMGSSSQNYISGDSPNNTAQSARELLKTELLGKLQFDVQAVLERVKVQDISSEFADDCVKAAKLNNHASDALRRLQHVVEKGGSEKDLYEPLQILFDFIADYGHHASSDDANEDNCFLFGDDKPLTLGLTDWTMPSDKPDCTILPRAIAPRSRPKSWVFPRQWWLRLGFGEVKLKKADGPGNDPAVVKPIVIQTADYARYHLAGRPFQLYSVGFLVFGSGFCVGIYDRAGVQFSPVFDILDDFTIFVKVVRSMTRNMTAAEYGMDPTARMLDPAEAERWQQQTSYQVGLECPAYEISLGGTYDVQRWITVGIPVWISVSLLGRGTLVWKVFNVLAPQQRKIMKNAWRRAGRSPESQIYNLIPNRHPGVSVLEIGSDVHVPGLDVAISTAWIRGELNLNEPEPIGPDHVVLHRLFIDTVGRPLWDYDSELELLKGIRAALAGHQFLCQHHILHRDISAGNVLLADTDSPEPGGEGFITDLEFALYSGPSDVVQQWINSPKLTPAGIKTEPAKVTHIRFNEGDVKHGAVMTGTLQFMAKDLLQYMASFSDSSKLQPPSHEPKHDIESFIWVLCYTILRRLSRPQGNSPATQKAANSIYKRFFGHIQAATITAFRTGEGPTMMITLPEVREALSPHTIEVLSVLGDMVTDANRHQQAIDLNHDAVLAVFDKAITSLLTSS